MWLIPSREPAVACRWKSGPGSCQEARFGWGRRKTRQRWPAGTRSASGLIGNTYAVSPRCGWATAAKPNVEGRPSPMSVQR